MIAIAEVSPETRQDRGRGGRGLRRPLMTHPDYGRGRRAAPDWRDDADPRAPPRPRERADLPRLLRAGRRPVSARGGTRPASDRPPPRALPARALRGLSAVRGGGGSRRFRPRPRLRATRARLRCHLLRAGRPALAYGLSPKPADPPDVPVPPTLEGELPRGRPGDAWMAESPLAVRAAGGARSPDRADLVPSFLLAVAGAADTGGMAEASPSSPPLRGNLGVLPALPGLGFLRRPGRWPGRPTGGGVIGAVYLYRGVVLLYGGIVSP
jgi:hypothetical protein